jgi:hypothetical protein
MSAELSVTMFIMGSTLFLALLPFFKRFSEHDLLDLIIRRGCWSIAIFLMVQNTGIVATLADAGSLNVTHDLFNTYLWIFGWGGYGLLVLLVIGTLFESVKIMRKNKDDRRRGHIE